VGARFFVLVQTDPGAHLTSYTMGTGFFSEVERPGRGVDHPPHLTPRLRKEYSYTSMEEEKKQKKVSKLKLPYHKTSGKTKK
jgi:DNA-binding sugar fermentation-stimulating protein